jgi:3',5'-cyclic AMP phosphodiesterase CpdA
MLLCQISDPHMVEEGALAYGRIDTPGMLDRCVRTILELPRRPDALIATGDLTEHATVTEYGFLGEILASLQMPIFLAVGNHDERAALQAAFPHHPHLRGLDGFVQYVIDEFAVRLVVLDTVVPNQEGGELCERRLRWLDRTLAQSDRPTIVAQHHPPFVTGLSYMDQRSLANPAAEAAVIVKHPHVERVISGHYHRNMQARFAGTVATACPSTAHQLLLDLVPGADIRFTYEPSSFHLHFWNGSEVVTHTGVVGDFPVWGTSD